MPCLIDVQHGLVGQPREQLRIGGVQRLAHLVDELRQVAAGDVHPYHVAKEFADGRERGVADALHEGHEGRQSWAEKTRVSYRFGQGRRMEFPTAIAPISQRLVFADDGRGGDDLHLLLHLGRIGRRTERTAAIGTAIERIGQNVVDGLVGKRRPQVLFMARLSAAFAFLASLAEPWAV